MSEPATTINTRHYQAVCSLALGAIVLLQLQQSTLATHISLVVSVLIGFIGVRTLRYRARISPMLTLLVIAVPHLIEQYTENQSAGPAARSPRLLDLGDVLLCVAALTYFIGHYRLSGLWHGVLPPDARLSPSDADKAPAPPQVRSERSLSVPELAALVFIVPVFAVVAQFGLVALNHEWPFLERTPALRSITIEGVRFLVWPVLMAAWTLLLTMFLTAQAFRYWRRLQMDRVSAMLLLQDVLWHETRGEQRRLNRWFTWKRSRM
jgi:hypothetical protein